VSLSPQQLRAVELILQGQALPAVAAAVGVTLPILYEWRYSLPWAEEMAKRQSDLRYLTQAMYLGSSRRVYELILEIAENGERDSDRLKACQMLNDMAFTETSVYTTQAEWNAARENATKSVLGSLWTLSDADIIDRVRNLKLLPKGE